MVSKRQTKKILQERTLLFATKISEANCLNRIGLTKKQQQKNYRIFYQERKKEQKNF